ncbi:MAG: substrate-binding domain-containing protein [Gammaproteobacteria bacterium]|nr:substrate-binding domain-containing protein [Gammaproteobacteria bacterium]MDH5801863.1 substrate-binding domain-containing protein [Gammaproteobacteria bacterium]
MSIQTRKKLILGLGMIAVAGSAMAQPVAEPKNYTLKGDCAFLPAARATEFHGNPVDADLRLGMAGNQWVVFDKVMQAFNLSRGITPAGEPSHHANPYYTLADLQAEARSYYIQLIPPGQIRKQIKSGCLVLGNDDDRNFLPGSIQVDFDVFASTNYNLMQDLAKSGFVTEAVPYIKNKLDLMVLKGNPKNIGTDTYPGTPSPEFDKQFDIIMDLLSGDTVTSNLDHINEGIHNAANNFMKASHDYVRANDNDANITMSYTLANGVAVTETHTASQWIQRALSVVALPLPGSPGAARLITRDAGENHASHNLADLGCVYGDGQYQFCEYATLNKPNTHESRVHHVETPNGLQGISGFVPVDVGFVWITELAYVLNQYATSTDAPVQGMVGAQDISNLGIPSPDGLVNKPGTYSLAVLATAKNPTRAQQFIDFVRSPEGQAAYTNGGFQGLTDAELSKGKCYSLDRSIPEPTFSEWDRVNNSCQ